MGKTRGPRRGCGGTARSSGAGRRSPPRSRGSCPWLLPAPLARVAGGRGWRVWPGPEMERGTGARVLTFDLRRDDRRNRETFCVYTRKLHRVLGIIVWASFYPGPKFRLRRKA